MRIFRKPEAVAWRPAPLWQSAAEGVVLAALPVLLLTPSSLGFTDPTRIVAWFGFAVLLGGYGWLFNRLRPANPPAEAIRPARVAGYGGAVLALVAAQVTACLTGGPRLILGVSALIVVLMTAASQWFERGVEARVRAQGLDRSPRRQSVNVLKEARRRARGTDDVPAWAREERISERWAREQRAARRAEEPEEKAPPGLDLTLPAAEEPEVRTVYRPQDRLPGKAPRPRRKRRR